MNNIRVLLTSVGSNTAISVIKALREKYSKLYIVGTDTNEKHLCSGHAFVDKFVQVPFSSEKQKYIGEIEILIVKENIDCLIPIHDLEIEVISEFKQQLSEYTFIATNELSVISLCNNKKSATKKAANTGLTVPGLFNESDFEFPLIAKPLKGVSSKDQQLLSNKTDLTNFLKINNPENFIIQEYIEGKEYTIDTYSTYNGEFYGAMVRERIETKAGISTKGVTINIPILEEYCKIFLNSLLYKGAANIQFIKRNGEFYFIEINPRFSGGGILSYEAGFNSPYLTLLESVSKELPPVTSLMLQYNLFMSRYWQESFIKK